MRVNKGASGVVSGPVVADMCAARSGETVYLLQVGDIAKAAWCQLQSGVAYVCFSLDTIERVFRIIGLFISV